RQQDAGRQHRSTILGGELCNAGLDDDRCIGCLSRRQLFTATKTTRTTCLDFCPACRADNRLCHYLTSRHERIRTPAWPTPLSYAFGSPKSCVSVPDPKIRCRSATNGAVARTLFIVASSVLSAAVTVP